MLPVRVNRGLMLPVLVNRGLMLPVRVNRGQMLPVRVNRGQMLPVRVKIGLMLPVRARLAHSMLTLACSLAHCSGRAPVSLSALSVTTRSMAVSNGCQISKTMTPKLKRST